MSSKLRYSIAHSIIKRIANQQRTKHGVSSYSSSLRFLLIMDAETAAQKQLLEPFLQQLKKEGKEIVKAIYFNKPKDLPEKKITDCTYLSRKDFNVFGIPKTKNLKYILNQKYDFLINLNMNNLLPLKSISSFSKSICRVGYNRDNNAHIHYDLCLGKQFENYSLANYIQDINTYLHKID